VSSLLNDTDIGEIWTTENDEGVCLPYDELNDPLLQELDT
jgi:hypothetical protein